MDYTHLGRTGLQVSRFCLGTMTFGRECDETVSHQLLDRFVGDGGNFIDTANSYGNGLSEEIIGKWVVSRKRHDIVMATKVRFGSGLNNRGLSRKHILDAIEDSLRRLKTDYIDIYQIHMWDDSTPLEESLSALDGLVHSGKVRYLGVSNFSGWQLQKTIEVCRALRWEPITCLQPLYNLLDRETEWELIPICLREGLGIIPWSPLRGGWLSGKFRRGMTIPEAETRIKKTEQTEHAWTEEWENYNNDATWKVVDALLEVAQQIGKSPAQVALNWLLQRPGVTAPIIGARNQKQLEDNLGALGWSLDVEHMERLEKVSSKKLPYPYALLQDLANA